MLTTEDKEWISDAISTNKEIVGLKGDVTELKVESSLLQQTVQRLEQRMEENIGLSQKTLAILEGLAGKVGDLDQENKMGAITLRRHDIQIHELATATGTAISE